MRFLDLFIRRDSDAAQQAKDRLQIIVARERSAGTRNGPADYLPELQQELLAVIARYEKIDAGPAIVGKLYAHIAGLEHELHRFGDTCAMRTGTMICRHHDFAAGNHSDP